jgi:hypothetical protein
MGPDKKPTILESVEVIKVDMQVTKSKKQGGRVGKQEEWGVRCLSHNRGSPVVQY